MILPIQISGKALNLCPSGALIKNLHILDDQPPSRHSGVQIKRIEISRMALNMPKSQFYIGVECIQGTQIDRFLWN